MTPDAELICPDCNSIHNPHSRAREAPAYVLPCGAFDAEAFWAAKRDEVLIWWREKWNGASKK